MDLPASHWDERLRKAEVSRSLMDQLVMDYLVIEGHKEAAVNFMAETGTQGAPSALPHTLAPLTPPNAHLSWC